MFDLTDPSLTIQMCKFQALIQKAHIVIKFPCSYFIEWKTINNRYSICTQKRVRTANDEAVFNERLTFYTEMVYNAKKKEYYSKETFLLLNLVSKSRPDQVKLVGRVSVDLAQVLNRGRYAQVQRVRLNYCSVEGSVVFGVKLLNKRDSNLSVKDLDRSAFTDYFSLNPINRMMIQESVNNSSNNNRVAQQQQQHQDQYRQSNQHQNQRQQQQQSVPTFGQIGQNPSPAQHKPTFPTHQAQYHHTDQQVISFQNSQRQQRYIDQSPRTNYSKEPSLIQKLEERNLRASEKDYTKQERQYSGDNNNYYQKVGNVVEVQSREARTERVNNTGENNSPHNYNNSTSNYTVGARARGNLNKVEEQAQTGQIRRQQTTTTSNKTPSQTKLQSSVNPPAISKPTSPPSHQRHLTHANSSSKFSQTSQSQNQQLLSIVQKLQHQKLQQQSMIQSLKSMLINKNMRKKELSRGSGHFEDSEFKKNQEIADENVALRRENESLVRQIERKDEELRQKNMHVFELLDKIKKLEMELGRYDEKIRVYEDEIADLHMKEIQNQKVCESLKLSLTMQPGYDNLVNRKGYDNILNGNGTHLDSAKEHVNKDIVVGEYREEEQMGLVTKKSSKLLDYFRTANQQPPNNCSHENQHNQLQTQKLSLSRQQPQPQQQFRITLTKDEKIYEQMEQQNWQLSERVKQLLQQVQIYKDLLKQQKAQQFTLKQSFPIPPSHILTSNNLNTDEIPFTITVSKNTNIYDNYQNLQQENNQLYDRIKELEQQVQGYRELMRDEGYDKQIKGNVMVESVQVKEMGEYQAVIANHNNRNGNRRDTTESQPPHSVIIAQSSNPTNQAQTHQHYHPAFQTTPISNNFQQQEFNTQPIIQTFKIILTKDKNIYKQQQQQNIQLSKRVLELQDQIDIYKQLLKNQNQPKSSHSINTATLQNQERYQGEGFTITLSKDKNIYENQEKEITEYEEQVKQLQETIAKYKCLYGQINPEPQYKVSITRQDRIYEDQQHQIKQLLHSLQQKDNQVIDLTTRLSWLQRQLELKHQNSREKIGTDQADFGEFKINIHRDQNIYDEQQNDIRDLSQRIIDLEGKLTMKTQELEQKEELITKLNQQLLEVKSAIEKPDKSSSELIKPTSLASNLPFPSPSHPHSPSQYTPIILSCLSCISLQNRLLQLQTTVQLLEQQKTMLQQQLGTLQEQKFCFTSTQNQLKITIEDLRDQINLLGQQNQRLVEELHFLHNTYGLTHNGEAQNKVYGSLKVDQRINGGLRGNEQLLMKDMAEDAVYGSKFALSLPENVFNQYKQTHHHHQQPQTPSTTTHHLQQLPPISPRSKQSQPHPSSPFSPSKLLVSLQQQNTHLRQSLSTFQEQLQQQYLTIGELQQRISRLMHEKQILFERDQQLSKEIIILSEKEQEVNEREVRFRERIGELERQLMAGKSQSLSTINTTHVTRMDSTESTGNSSKLRTLQLQKQVQCLKHQLRQLSLKASNQSQQLSFSQQQLQLRGQQLQSKQNQLEQKQHQIHQLQTQLQALNQSLTELSHCYQSLQKNIIQLQQQKDSQVESIRQEYESMNRLLKDELESIQTIILQKQRICQQNQTIVRDRQLKIAQMEQKIAQMQTKITQMEQKIAQMQTEIDHLNNEKDNNLREIQAELAQATSKLHQVQGFNEDLSANIESITKINQQLGQQNTNLNQQLQILKHQLDHLQQVKTLSPQQLNYKQRLLYILQQIKHSKLQQSLQVAQLLPLVTQKLNQSQFPSVIHGEEQLARLISKEVQKIKINIMRNYQTSVGGKEGVIQRTVPIRTGYNQQAKSFAEKSAMLNYLKPIEELIKGY